MSQENVEIVRGIYERWSEGDFRASVDLLDPHVVLVLEAVAAYTGGATQQAEPRERAYRERACLIDWRTARPR